MTKCEFLAKVILRKEIPNLRFSIRLKSLAKQLENSYFQCLTCYKNTRAIDVNAFQLAQKRFQQVDKKRD